MSNILGLADIPTDIDMIHESCYRSYHIFAEVKHMLELGVPPPYILELIKEMESLNGLTKEYERRNR